MSETTVIRHIPPCSSCDLESLESWLSDLARQGQHLKDVGRYSWHFAKGAPREVPYRLIPGRKKLGAEKLSDDPQGTTLEKYAAMGWEYVARQGHFFIFRGMEDFDGLIRVEPRVGPEDIAVAIKQERREFPHMILALFVVMPLLLYAFYGWGRPLLWLNEQFWVLACTLLITLVYCLHVGMHLLQLRKLRVKLENGFRLDHKKDWKQASARNRVGKVIFILFVTLWSFVLGLFASPDRDYNLLSEYPGDPPMPTMEDILPEGELLSHDGLYYETPGLLIPVQIEWVENAMVQPRREVYYRTTYYETLTPAMARELAEELLHEEQKDYGYTAEPLPDLDLNYAVVYHQDQTVLLQEGTVVLQATLIQDEEYLSLEDWTAQLAEALL